MKERHKYAYLGLGIGVVAVSTSAIFVKLSTAPSSIVALYRLLFTVLILGIPTLYNYRGDFKYLNKKQWLYSVVSGLFLAFHFITWFESLNYTSVASSVVLVTLQPVFAMIGVYFIFKERINFLGVFGTILALFGSFIIGWGDFRLGELAIIGDVLALLGAILVTGYWLVGQSIRKNLALLPYTFLVYGTSTVVLLLYNIFNQINLFHYSSKNWILFLLLAIIPTIFGHTVFNWAIKYVSATTVSMTILLEPIGASILAYFILNESVNFIQLIGGFIIFLGIFIYLRYK